MFVQNHRTYNTKLNPKVNYELWVIMYQSRFILGKKKCTILVSDDENEGNYACVGAGGMFEISVPSKFCYKPKTVLEKLDLNTHTHTHTHTHKHTHNLNLLTKLTKSQDF